MSHTILFLALAAAAARAQSFEVASIRSAPLTAQSFTDALTDGSLNGVEITPGRVRIGRMPLDKLIRTAYGVVRIDDLAVPDWLDNDFRLFNIDAKLPADATADQVPLMLQALLADRFKLTVRRGSREADTYALLIGKDGLKAQNKEPAGDPNNPSTSEPRVTVAQGPNNETTVFLRTMRGGVTKVTSVPGVAIRVETSTISGLVDALTQPGALPLDVPVIDKTGLKGSFDIKMEILLPGRAALIKAGAPQLPVTPDAVSMREFLDASKEWNAAHRDLLSAPAFAAVERLGLKLEKQKNMIETITVEQMDKNPTEN